MRSGSRYAEEEEEDDEEEDEDDEEVEAMVTASQAGEAASLTRASLTLLLPFFDDLGLTGAAPRARKAARAARVRAI